jgi:Tfp pilus assembly protein PilF
MCVCLLLQDLVQSCLQCTWGGSGFPWPPPRPAGIVRLRASEINDFVRQMLLCHMHRRVHARSPAANVCGCVSVVEVIGTIFLIPLLRGGPVEPVAESLPWKMPSGLRDAQPLRHWHPCAPDTGIATQERDLKRQGILYRGLRGGEPEAACGVQACGAQEAAILRSVGQTVCLAQEMQRDQLRDRLLHRVPLDHNDEVHLAALRTDPTNVRAVKAHASALVPSSALSDEGWSYAAASVRPGHAGAGISRQEKAAGWEAEEVVPLPDDGDSWHTHLGLDAKYTPIVVGREVAGGEKSKGLIRAGVAVDLYRYALMLDPSDPDAWLALAHLHLATNQFAAAPPAGTAAVKSASPSSGMGEQEPQDQASAYNFQEAGGGQHASGARAWQTVAAAAAMMDMAVKMDPAHAPALLARGNLQREALHDLHGSHRSLLRALKSLKAQRGAVDLACETGSLDPPCQGSLDPCLRGSVHAPAPPAVMPREEREERRPSSPNPRGPPPKAAAARNWAPICKVADGATAAVNAAICKVLTSLGLTAEARGDGSEAEMRYRAALGVWAHDASPALLLALLLHEQGRRDEAKAVLGSAAPLCLSASPTDAAVHYNLALMLLEEGSEGSEGSEGHVQQALVLLQQAVRLTPWDGEIRTKLAWLLFVTDEDAEAAQEMLRQVLAEDPGDARALVCLSRVMQELKSDLHRDLQPLIERALKHKPNDPLIRREHGRLLEMLHDLPGAQDQYRRARALDPSDAYTLLSLARILAFSDTLDGADDETFVTRDEDGQQGKEQQDGQQENEQQDEQQEGQALCAWVRTRPRPSAAPDPLRALSPELPDACQEEESTQEDNESGEQHHQAPQARQDEALEAAPERQADLQGPSAYAYPYHYDYQASHYAYGEPERQVYSVPPSGCAQHVPTTGRASEGHGDQGMNGSAFRGLEEASRFRHLEEARHLLDEALELEPHSIEAHIARAQLLGGGHCALHDPREAEASLRKALLLAPRHVEALATLGDVLIRKGDLQEGVAAWMAAIHLAPSDPDLRYNLACQLSTFGDLSPDLARDLDPLEAPPHPSHSLPHGDCALLAQNMLSSVVSLDPAHVQVSLSRSLARSLSLSLCFSAPLLPSLPP